MRYTHADKISSLLKARQRRVLCVFPPALVLCPVSFPTFVCIWQAPCAFVLRYMNTLPFSSRSPTHSSLALISEGDKYFSKEGGPWGRSNYLEAQKATSFLFN